MRDTNTVMENVVDDKTARDLHRHVAEVTSQLSSVAATARVNIAYLGLDVYEQEADFFYEYLSEIIIQDDVLQRLNIADTTVAAR